MVDISSLIFIYYLFYILIHSLSASHRIMKYTKEIPIFPSKNDKEKEKTENKINIHKAPETAPHQALDFQSRNPQTHAGKYLTSAYCASRY